MWLLGLLLVTASAFLFANTQWIVAKINFYAPFNGNDWLLAKLPALVLLLAGGYLNNWVWAVESGIALTIGVFGLAMVLAVYFQLDKPKTSNKNHKREAN